VYERVIRWEFGVFNGERVSVAHGVRDIFSWDFRQGFLGKNVAVAAIALLCVLSGARRLDYVSFKTRILLYLLTINGG
jgi:hypothetical protein